MWRAASLRAHAREHIARRRLSAGAELRGLRESLEWVIVERGSARDANHAVAIQDAPARRRSSRSDSTLWKMICRFSSRVGPLQALGLASPREVVHRWGGSLGERESRGSTDASPAREGRQPLLGAEWRAKEGPRTIFFLPQRGDLQRDTFFSLFSMKCFLSAFRKKGRSSQFNSRQMRKRGSQHSTVHFYRPVRFDSPNHTLHARRARAQRSAGAKKRRPVSLGDGFRSVFVVFKLRDLTAS
jgi:hypothetical protein